MNLHILKHQAVDLDCSQLNTRLLNNSVAASHFPRGINLALMCALMSSATLFLAQWHFCRGMICVRTLTQPLCVCFQEFHYRPPGSDACLPCDCYPVGSFSRSCDPESGQCQCRPGVIGRQCNSCDNPFAEVTNSGCEGRTPWDVPAASGDKATLVVFVTSASFSTFCQNLQAE